MSKEPTKAEIEAVINKCAELEDEGRNPFFGMTYVQGVRYAIEWMLGEGENPLDE